MMMAHDSGSSKPIALDATVVDGVRAALASYLRAPNGQQEALRAALHALGAEARRVNVPPEQLLILLKTMWHTLPDMQGAATPADRQSLLQRVVSMCIGEYFADP